MRSVFHLVALLAFAVSEALSAPSERQQVCNGHAELCDRSYGNITFIGSHDSYAFSSDPLVLAADQRVDVPTQLSLGVRMLQGQTHMHLGKLNLCHTSCIEFNGGTVLAYLQLVKTFLDDNPNEVITILFTNPEGLSLQDVWASPFEESGIAAMSYIPPTLPMQQSAWPTLGELIASGTRVISFVDFIGSDGTTVPYISEEFENLWETPFSVTDPTFPCSVDRTAGPLPNDEHMYMINHSLNVDIFGAIVSDPADANTTNGVPSILANAYGCTQFADGRAPNIVLLDFVNIGDAFHAADILNGFATA